MASTHGRTLAVVGATGLVGRAIIEGLIARKFPIKRLLPVASERSKGKTVDFKGEVIEVMTIEEAIEQKPNQADLHRDRALVLTLRGDQAKACEDVEVALSLLKQSKQPVDPMLQHELQVRQSTCKQSRTMAESD